MMVKSLKHRARQERDEYDRQVATARATKPCRDATNAAGSMGECLGCGAALGEHRCPRQQA